MPGGIEVSVILPVRNGGSYLAPAVASILNQTLHKFELLLVDDHSTDSAIEQVWLDDPRVRLLKSPGRGVVAAFNYGQEFARGRFVARMDADDLCLPHRLATQVDFLRSHQDIGIAGGCVEIFSEDGIQGGYIHYQEWLNSVCSPEQLQQQLFIESPIPNPTAMFRYEVLKQLGGYREVEWPEDYDLFLRADQAGIRMAKPAGIVLRWREHPARLTRTNPRYSRFHFQQAKAHFLVSNRLPDGPVLIWGAGSTGRQMYDLLQAQGREVCGFIEVHPRRIGGLKRGKPVWDMHQPGQWAEGFILVAVGSKGAREEISAYLSALGRQEGTDFLFVA